MVAQVMKKTDQENVDEFSKEILKFIIRPRNTVLVMDNLSAYHNEKYMKLFLEKGITL